MTSRIAKFLTAALFFGLTRLASAEIPAMDVFNSPGVPDTSYYATVMGPCYCDQKAYFSTIFILKPGTYNFGKVRDYWVQSGATPDGGDDQANLYLLFSPVKAVGLYPYDFPFPPYYANPSGALCDQDDAACNAKYVGAYEDFDLTLTVLPGQNAAEFSLIGNYLYTSPVPEPSALAMLFLGLTLIAGISNKRARPVRRKMNLSEFPGCRQRTVMSESYCRG